MRQILAAGSATTGRRPRPAGRLHALPEAQAISEEIVARSRPIGETCRAPRWSSGRRRGESAEGPSRVLGEAERCCAPGARRALYRPNHGQHASLHPW